MVKPSKPGRERTKCPVCETPVLRSDDWTLTSPHKERFLFCSLPCLIDGASNLDEIGVLSNEER